ncbi:hypothetical protein PHLGIDRAFT_120684, partial [Phlebiopsis gigantea 11061_1 CR5-6]
TSLPSRQSATVSTDFTPGLVEEREPDRAASKTVPTSEPSLEEGSSKRPSRPRPSRSIKQIPGAVRPKLVDTAYRYMRARITGVNAYPDKTETNEMVCDAWLDSWSELADDGVVLDGLDRDMTKEEIALIRSRISQARGDLKDVACRRLDRFYVFDRAPPQATNPLAIKNKNFYSKLIVPERKPLFLRLGAPANADAADALINPVDGLLYGTEYVQCLINEAYFSSPTAIGITHRRFFTTADRTGISVEVLAFVGTAIRYALDQWKQGYEVGGKDWTFAEKVYKSVYDTLLKFLRGWEAFAKESQSMTLLTLQRKILSSALAWSMVDHSGDDGEGGFTHEDFAAEETGGFE